MSEQEDLALVRYMENRLNEFEMEEASKQLRMPVHERIRLSRAARVDRDEHARIWLRMLDAAEHAGRIQEPALFYLRAHVLEKVHDDRLTHEPATVDFARIQANGERIRKAYGLSDDEWWGLGEGPHEWHENNREFEKYCDDHQTEVFSEFGMTHMAELFSSNSAEFNRRREQGRKAMHEGLSEADRLDALRSQFYEEAKRSALVQSYHGAAALIGAALEALLLMKCLEDPPAAVHAANQLHRHKRPTAENPRKWRFVDMCEVAAQAGWLPVYELVGYDLSGDSLASTVRDLRNMLHPAKQLRESELRPAGTMVVRAHYEDARAAYELLERHLYPSRGNPRPSD